MHSSAIPEKRLGNAYAQSSSQGKSKKSWTNFTPGVQMQKVRRSMKVVQATWEKCAYSHNEPFHELSKPMSQSLGET